MRARPLLASAGIVDPVMLPVPRRAPAASRTLAALALALPALLAPVHVAAQVELAAGPTCLGMGATRGAISACRAALRATPGDVRLQVRLADALAASGEDLAALDAYRVAMRMAPDSAAAWFGAARVLDNRGDRRGALRYYREYARLTPRDADGPEIVGWLLLEIKQPAEALVAFREAMARSTTSGGGAYGTGLALAALGRHAEAVPALEHAVRLSPGNAGGWGALARSAAVLGRDRDAVSYWARALVLDRAYFDGRDDERRQWQRLGRRTGPQAPAAVVASAGSVAPASPAAPPRAASAPPAAPVAPVPVARTRRTAVVATGTTGSGFVVAARGYVLTNRHVVRGCQAVRVRPEGGAARPATVVALDPDDDLALLRTDTTFGAVAAFRGGRDPRAGEAVVAVGYPLNGLLADQAHVTIGSISALAGLYNDLHELTISTPVQPGNSGGPLLDAYGTVVGVVVTKLNARVVQETTGDLPQNVNFAIKGGVAREFLAAQGIVPLTGLPVTPLSNADVGDVGRSVALLVECTR